MIKRTKFGALKSLAVAGFVGAWGVAVSQGATITGADLITGASWNASVTTGTSGSSGTYTNSSDAGWSRLAGSYATGSSVTIGNTYSFEFDFTRVQSDWDISIFVTDGFTVWGGLIYDPSNAGFLTGAYTGLDTIYNSVGGGSGSMTPFVGVSSSGTITWDFTFNAGDVTVSIDGGTFAPGGSVTETLGAAPVSAAPLTLLFGSNSTPEVYQINSLDSSAIGAASAPEPTSALLASLGLGVFAFRRKRKTL